MVGAVSSQESHYYPDESSTDRIARTLESRIPALAVINYLSGKNQHRAKDALTQPVMPGFGPFGYIVTRGDLAYEILNSSLREGKERPFGKGPSPLADSIMAPSLILTPDTPTSEIKRWRQQRQDVAPVVSHSSLRRQTDDMRQNMQSLNKTWQAELEARPSFEVDLAEIIPQLTLDNLIRAFTAQELSPQIKKDIGHAILDFVKWSFLKANPAALGRYLPTAINTVEKRAIKATQYLQEILPELIDGETPTPPGQSQGHETLIGVMKATGYDQATIVGEMLGMYIAGQETTANTINWLFYVLHRAPVVEQKILAELEQVVGDRPLEMSDLPKLVYLEAALKEVLRLFPVVSQLIRQVMHDTTLGGVEFKAQKKGKNQLVAIPLMPIHTHPEIWQDPESFMPERFIPGNPLYAGDEAVEKWWLPFGKGPHECIGEKFSLEEAKYILASTLPKYRVQITEIKEGQKAEMVFTGGGPRFKSKQLRASISQRH